MNMDYLIYDGTSRMTKATITARCFAEIDTQRNLQPVVVDNEVRFVLHGESFIYGNAITGFKIVVHEGDFFIKMRR